MKTSQKGINLIAKYEGCRLEAYKDPVGVWTIGYGHTANVRSGQVITKAQAEDLLRDDLSKFEAYVSKYVKIALSQSQFDALVSFTYNVGAGNLKSSTLLKKLNSGDYAGAANEFPRWNKAGGKVLNGLVKRRAEEQQLFLSGTATNKSGVRTFSLSKDGNVAVSKNFKVREFRCKDGSDSILIDVGFVTDKLQNIRDHFGVPITINSAYRTSSYNKKVGGASKSYHLQGRAFDIVVKGINLDEVCRYAKSIGIKGIIRYNTFVHVDSRETAYYARNNNGKVTKVSSF